MADVSGGIRIDWIAARRATIIEAARDPEGYLSGTVRPMLEQSLAAIPPDYRLPSTRLRLEQALADLPQVLRSLRGVKMLS